MKLLMKYFLLLTCPNYNFKIYNMTIINKASAILLLLLLINIRAYSKHEALNEYTTVDSLSEKIEYQKLQFKLGLNLGWEFPYSVGPELSFLFNELVDVNIGGGAGASGGGKFGTGARIYPTRSQRFSPMIGTYLYHTTGISKIKLTVNNVEASYKIPSDNALLIDAGLRVRFGKGHYLIAGIGYSLPFKHEDAEYIDGSTDKSVQSFANNLKPGGFSINVGFLIKLSKGYYRKY